ncbi:GNAT family N-acetyltransferase [Christiangramia sp. ASW11-125]|uniref:GNAT family N-acetyltransferase n=1 Tax=Christiangramia sp. ASW11-125 TaxID=3400701 RepID=UPI003AAC5561
MNSYKFLSKEVFSRDEYSIVPIRMEDRYNIMKWRNEQMYHLRQNEPLTKEKQDNYFDSVIARIFEEDKPNQILFSYLRGNECIGYGGLVHINWIDRNAEISFIMKTDLQQLEFYKHWEKYLDLIEEVAFYQLDLHKIHTFAFDLRTEIYEVLEKADFIKEAVLKEHCYFEERYIDVIIHSKFNQL